MREAARRSPIVSRPARPRRAEQRSRPQRRPFAISPPSSGFGAQGLFPCRLGDIDVAGPRRPTIDVARIPSALHGEAGDPALGDVRRSTRLAGFGFGLRLAARPGRLLAPARGAVDRCNSRCGSLDEKVRRRVNLCRHAYTQREQLLRQTHKFYSIADLYMLPLRRIYSATSCVCRENFVHSPSPTFLDLANMSHHI